MVDKKRMVAVAIGVSNAEDMRFLPGALNCATKFFEWAQALGYEARLVTDEDNSLPVTVDRLRDEFDAILKDPRAIHRIVIYFAGHGMIRELENGLWFLSDWKKEGLVVAYESLRRRLATFGIDQIAIFSDACRSLPKSARDLLLEERSVLALGPRDGDADLDKFVAAKDGQQTYAVPGSTEADDVCVFSGVLLEALWGTKQEAFSQVAPNNITSSSLGNYLRAEVPRAAKKYGLTLRPSVSPAFPEGDNIYFTAGLLTSAVPPFGWPPPPQGLSPEPPPPSPLTAPESFEDIVSSAPSRADRGAPRGFEESTPSAPKKARLSLLDRLRQQKLPDGFDTGAGFAVEGAAIRRLWTPETVLAEPHLNASWWKVRASDSSRLTSPAPILIEFDDGRFAATAALPDFVTGAVCDRRGVSAVVYRPSYSPAGARSAEDVIGRLERGALRADAVTGLAVRLRLEKHVDPVLGVFAAYLYDSIGDLGSIRRMAYYYVQHQQPIPYDIALLAQVHCRRDGDQSVAYVPAVPQRKPRSEEERQHSWTYEGTPAQQGIVGGAWPWLRQGWAFLADPTDSESTLIRPGLEKLSRHLGQSRFATFDNQGGNALAALFQLVPRNPHGEGGEIPAAYPVTEAVDKRPQQLRRKAGKRRLHRPKLQRLG
jgi:hypothetical protein